MNITIDQDKSTYVKSTNGGSDVWDFESAFNETRLLAKRLGRPELSPFQGEFGSLSVVKKHKQLLQLAESADLGTWYQGRTPVVVQHLIDRLIHTGEVVRIFYGDIETGLASLDEFHMIGVVRRSGDILKRPTLLSIADGFARPLKDDQVIRVIRTADHKNLYCHQGFHIPPMRIVENEHPHMPATVLAEGVMAGRFKSYVKAAQWVAFMGGESCRQPG